MTRATLLALAERVEKAKGPDRELDAEIAAAVAPGNCIAVVGKRPGYYMATIPRLTRRKAAAFTASLDAALTLVPEGWTGSIHLNGKAMLYRDDGRPSAEGHAFAPALALTAAALRARAS